MKVTDYHRQDVHKFDNAIILYYFRLFKLLGTVFTFVNSDVVEKMGILKDYRSSELRDEYETIQSMINFEVKNNKTNNKTKASGSRTLLRLHRALDFVTDFMKSIKEADKDAKLSGVGAQSYDRTLAKHHPWLIRKGVHIAVYTLPTRVHFMEKLKVTDVAHTEDLLGKTAALGHNIFEIVEKVYADNKLLDLP